MVHTFDRDRSSFVPLSFPSCAAWRIGPRSRSVGSAEAPSVLAPLRTKHGLLRRCRLVAEDEARVESIGKEIR
jgi:hypothetical protein